MSHPRAADIAALAQKYTPDIVRFLRDMIAIPSESADERQRHRARRRGDATAAASTR